MTGELPTEFHYTARGQLALRAGQLNAAIQDFNSALAVERGIRAGLLLSRPGVS